MVANVETPADAVRNWRAALKKLVTVVHGQVELYPKSLTLNDAAIMRYLAYRIEKAVEERDKPSSSSPEKVYCESWCPRCKQDSCEEFWEEIINNEDYGFAKCCLCGSVYEYYGPEDQEEDLT